MRKEYTITITTPTYNREYTLTRLYNSLLQQKYKNFKWLVIDDGSTDNTKELVGQFIKEKKIDIIYKYKENGGKMSAINMAHKLCDTDYMITVDSDDMLADNFLTYLIEDIDLIEKNDEIAGMVYLTAKLSNVDEIVGTKLPDDKTICKFHEIYDKYKCQGDKCIVWKTKILKKYFYPIIDGEKFIADAYLMNMISEKYNVMTMNRIATLIEYQQDGYSANYFRLVKNNPKGNVLYFKQLYSINKTWYNVYGYILFSIYAKYKFKYILKNHSAKIKIILLYIPTYIVSKLR